MSDVEHVDFGKERRDLERMMGRLLGLAEKQREELRRDPVRYYRRAVDEITALKQYVEDIENAAHYALGAALTEVIPVPLAPSQPVMLHAEDYARYERVMAIVERGPKRTQRAQKSDGRSDGESDGL